MTIDKLKNGHWRIRHFFNGKRYSLNVDHRPTQKEAMRLIEEKYAAQNKIVYDGYMDSFSTMAWEYIADAEKRLSPSTIRGYASLCRNTPEEFGQMSVDRITEKDVQEVVDLYAETHSPKSTSLYLGFLKSVFKWKRPKLTLDINLPKPEKRVEYEPTTEDIKRILEEASGTEFEVMFRLCALGVRRGEVLALTLDDLDDHNVLTINKDKVMDRNGNILLKDKPKTEESNRRILIPDTLADLIREQGYFYRLNPNTANKHLHLIQDKLGIPNFRLHMLRHFAAAYLHQKGFTDSQILAYGGWSESSDVMKRVYRYNLDPADSQKNISNAFKEL